MQQSIKPDLDAVHFSSLLDNDIDASNVGENNADSPTGTRFHTFNTKVKNKLSLKHNVIQIHFCTQLMQFGLSFQQKTLVS